MHGTGIDNGSVQKGMPTAYIRGGYRLLNEQAGAFNLDVTYGPSYFYQILGARCCLGSR